MNSKRYVVITPVRNEEKFLQLTIDSMVAQTVRPQQWIVVDDGSSDSTAAIAEAATRRHAWIALARRPDRGSRMPGTGVIEAFDEGYRLIRSDDWEFVVKLDGDLSFEPGYFAQCLSRFEMDSGLGIGGGTISNKLNGELAAEAPEDPAFHVRGATKIYKRDCWDALGGLIQLPGWDTVDEYKANMLGWSTYTFPEIKLWHHRAAGDAQGRWKNWIKNGLANYIAGYHPLFMGCKCVRRAWCKPYVIGALGLFVGFLRGYMQRVPQVQDRDLIRYIRAQQLRRLLFRESLWDQKPLGECA